MPLQTNVSSNSSGPSFGLDIAVVGDPGPGAAAKYVANVTMVADASQWSLEKKVTPEPDFVQRPKKGTKGKLTIVWLERKITAKQRHFKFVLKRRVTNPKSGVSVLVWDPNLGAMATGAWVAKKATPKLLR